MQDSQAETDPTPQSEASIEEKVVPRRRFTFRRLGCGLLVAGWFVFLLTPCLLIYLAFAGEIIFTHSDMPDDNLRIWTISSTTSRGIAVSNAHRIDTSNGLACTLTDARFFVWQGKAGDPNHYCTCYTHNHGEYQLAFQGDDACQIAEAK